MCVGKKTIQIRCKSMKGDVTQQGVAALRHHGKSNDDVSGTGTCKTLTYEWR